MADPMHWWTDVASRAHLASIDDRLAGQPLLVPPLSDWQRDGLVALGVDLGRILDLDVPGGELVRFAKLYFPGALSLGGRGAISLDTALANAMRVAKSAVLDGQSPVAGRRIFVPRSANGNRAILNEAGVTTALTDNGFEIVFPGLSFEETVRTFAAAEVVLVVNGGNPP